MVFDHDDRPLLQSRLDLGQDRAKVSDDICGLRVAKAEKNQASSMITSECRNFAEVEIERQHNAILQVRLLEDCVVRQSL